MEKPEAGVPGWEPLGVPRPQDRTWRFISFDPHEETDLLAKKRRNASAMSPCLPG